MKLSSAASSTRAGSGQSIDQAGMRSDRHPLDLTMTPMCSGSSNLLVGIRNLVKVEVPSRMCQPIGMGPIKFTVGSRAASTVNGYGLSQEFTTRYTSEQSGLVERFFRSVKGGADQAAPMRAVGPSHNGYWPLDHVGYFVSGGSYFIRLFSYLVGVLGTSSPWCSGRLGRLLRPWFRSAERRNHGVWHVRGNGVA